MSAAFPAAASHSDELSPQTAPESPCVGVCQLAGEVCIGCGRQLREIAEWPRANHPRQREIIELARQRRSIILGNSPAADQERA